MRLFKMSSLSVRTLLLTSMVALALGCGNADPGGGAGADGGGAANGDGGGAGGGIDSGIGGNPQCSDAIDNDDDGAIDGFDPECTGPADNDESSFATGIPGDNIDAVKQDCFFDGNSGHGDDGCDIHVCCLLDGECPAELKPNLYDPAKCEQTQECIDFCAPLTPPGCDCFGCCTICSGDNCVDILTNPAVAPDCTSENAMDPTKCPTCTKSVDCGPGGDPCYELECALCPGQDPSDLPPECNNMNECPNGAASCIGTACAVGQYCSNGCCINVVE